MVKELSYIVEADIDELDKVDGIGEARATAIRLMIAIT